MLNAGILKCIYHTYLHMQIPFRFYVKSVFFCLLTDDSIVMTAAHHTLLPHRHAIVHSVSELTVLDCT